MFEVPTQSTRRWWTVPFTMAGELSVVVILASMPATHVQSLPALAGRMVLLTPPPPPAAAGRQEHLKNPVKKIRPPKADSSRHGSRSSEGSNAGIAFGS